MPAKVILNPYSNRWNGQARSSEAEAALTDAGVQFELVRSERRGHPAELAERAAREGFSPVIAAGGDGTIGDVVNGLARAAGSSAGILGPLGIIPIGTSNDTAFSLGLPTGIAAAARVIAAGQTRCMDLGKLNDRYFANNSACGLEPYVGRKQEAIHGIKGTARYVVAALQAILDKPEWRARIEWDDGEYEGPLSLASIGNGRRSGGFFMTPHADMFDGRLTLTFGHRATRLGLLAALPRALSQGTRSVVYLEGIREVQATRIAIHLDRPSPAHTDGELIPVEIRDFAYSVLPGKLRVLVP